MDRREFLRGAGAAAALPVGSPQRGTAPRKPNLLLLLAGGWRGQALAAAGDANLKAPNLDRLAATGTLFSRAYVSNPDCSPSRASLFTGRFPHACGVVRNGVRLPLAERCLSDELRKAGYATGFIGQWGLDGEDKPGFVPPGPRRRGFGFWAAFNRGRRYFDSLYFRDDDQPIRGHGFEPDYQTGLALEFIQQNAGRPFFLCLSWGPPHPPRTPPPGFTALYNPEKLALRYNVPAGESDKTREALAGYYGLCSALDRDAGRLLDALGEHGIADDTMVVFTSDHGDMLGSQGLDQSAAPYEEAVRAPLLVRYPKVLKGGQVNPMLVSNVDLMPTLLSIAGAPPPPEAQGRDLSQQLLLESGAGPESIFCQGQMGAPQEWRMVVRGLDKIVVDRDLKVTHLYNVGQDPYELENLATDSAHSVRRDEMGALLRDWMHRLGDGILPSGLKLRR